jgi:hypothetical protein
LERFKEAGQIHPKPKNSKKRITHCKNNGSDREDEDIFEASNIFEGLV